MIDDNPCVEETNVTNGADYLHPEVLFLQRLDDLGVPLWVATIAEYGDAECSRPKDWQNLTHEENDDRLTGYHAEYAPYVAVNTGLPFVVFDCDTKNGCDVEKVRALLARLKVRIYADVITPSGGRHFYIRGHPDLVTVHSRRDNPKLVDFPGLDIQSFRANVWAPGTFRYKHGFFVGGYTIVYDHLDQLTPDDAADDGTEALVDWLAEQLAHKVKEKAAKTPGGAKEWTWDPCEPWDGTPPDRPQQAYMNAALASEADKVATTAKGGRNDALFVAALKLGSSIAGAGLDEQTVIAALEAAANTNGLTAEDGVQSVRATIRSGLRGGKRNPRAVPEPTTREGSYENGVADELMKLRIRAEAKRRYDEQTQGPAPPFDAGLLSEILERPEEPGYRIEDVLPSQASLLVAALRKTGKTTMMLNLARCLSTGEKFLDRFAVRPIAGQVGILNFEMSAAQLARWASAVGVPEDRLVLVNLRGRRNPLSHADDRARLADYLREHTVESLIVDPFGRAYTGKSQNDPGEVGAWLTALDSFARTEVGVFDLVLTAHMGWSGERVRGASAIEDWADAIAYLTKDDDARYFSALGRDVTIEEDRLHYDDETRLLSLTGGGSRKQAARNATVAALLDPVTDHVRGNPGVSVTDIRKAMRALHREDKLTVSFQDCDIRDAIKAAESRGWVRVEIGGAGMANRHYPGNPSQTESRSNPIDSGS